MGKRKRRPETLSTKKFTLEAVTILCVWLGSTLLAWTDRISGGECITIYIAILSYAFGRLNGNGHNLKVTAQALADKIDHAVFRFLLDDPVIFVRVVLGFEPYDYQAEFLHALRDIKRAVLCWGRQSGKTTAVAAGTIWFAFTHPGTPVSPTQVLVVSKALRQSMIMFRAIKSMIHSNPLLVRSIVYESRTMLAFSNHAEIIVLPCGHDGHSIRGYSAKLLIVDEAAFMKESIITEVCFPMLATTQGSMFMLSTPYGKKHVYYTSFMHPGFWKRHIPSSRCPRITKEFLEEQEKLIGQMKFKQEYLAEFVDDSNSWLPQDLIREVVEDYRMIPEAAVVTDTVETGKKYLHDIGVDFGKKHDHTVIMVLRRERFGDGPERQRLIFRKIFPLIEADSKKKSQKIYSEVLAYLRQTVKAFDVASLTYDETGVGEAIGEDISEFYEQAKGVNLSDVRKKDVMTFLRTRIEQHRIIVPYEKDLMDEMNIEEFRLIGDKILFSHPEGTHDDQLWALALGVFGTYAGEPLPVKPVSTVMPK